MAIERCSACGGQWGHFKTDCIVVLTRRVAALKKERDAFSAALAWACRVGGVTRSAAFVASQEGATDGK